MNPFSKGNLAPTYSACAIHFRVTSACFPIPSLQPDYPSCVQFVISLNDGKLSFVFGVLQNCAICEQRLRSSANVILNCKIEGILSVFTGRRTRR